MVNASEVDTQPVRTREEVSEAKKVNRLFIIIVFLEIAVNYDSGAVPAVLQFIVGDFQMKPAEQGLLGGLQYLGLTLMAPVAGKLLSTYNAKKTIIASLVFNIAFCALFAMAPTKGTLLFCRLGIGMTQTPLVVFAPGIVAQKLVSHTSQRNPHTHTLLVPPFSHRFPYLPPSLRVRNVAVWVDEFGGESAAMWLSVLQGRYMTYVQATASNHAHHLFLNSTTKNSGSIPLGVMVGYSCAGAMADVMTDCKW